jgi:hypothetical protein
MIGCHMVINMKTTTALKLLVISLAFIFIIGPTTASRYDSLESAILSGYKSSSGYSLLEPHFEKPDLNVFTDFTVKPKSDLAKFDLFEKDLWQTLPTSGPYCSTCGYNNATKTFGSVFTHDFSSPVSGFFFGGAGGGAGASGGGGCCG